MYKISWITKSGIVQDCVLCNTSSEVCSAIAERVAGEWKTLAFGEDGDRVEVEEIKNGR